MSFYDSTNCGLTSIETLTEELRVSAATVYRWMRSGWLQGVMVGRRRYFTREQLKRFEQRASTGAFAGIFAGDPASEEFSTTASCGDSNPPLMAVAN